MTSDEQSVLYFLYRSDGGRTSGSLCDLLHDVPENKGRQRHLWMGDLRRLVERLELQGLIHRYGIEDGVWWFDLTPIGRQTAKEVFNERHPNGLTV